ncbi:MAG: manganese efflux pump [Ignavibacteriales bacterium]
MIITVILLSLSMCLDNLVIGIAYGIKKIKINTIDNIIIASITTLGTLIVMILGMYLKLILPTLITKLLGTIIIIALGLIFIIQNIIEIIKNHNGNINKIIDYAEKTDLNKSGDIDKKEAILIALGLMINNLGIGVVASVAGISIYLTVVFTFIVSIITVKVGVLMGSYFFGNFFGKYATLIGGILLVILGLLNIIKI